MHLTSLELGYVAGILDGEGTIGIYRDRQWRGTTYWNARLSVTSTDYRLIAWLKERLGGYIDVHHQMRTDSRKPYSRWTLRKIADVTGLLLLVEPYLIIKRDHAQLALAFLRTKERLITQGKTPVKETADIMFSFKKQMNLLNLRGVVAPNALDHARLQASLK